MFKNTTKNKVWISKKEERIINSTEKRKNQQVRKASWRKGASELPFESGVEDD